MSFIGTTNQGTTYAPGFFVANGDEDIVRETRTIPQAGATSTDRGKYHKAGELYPANDATVEGFLYEDVDVTAGAMPGSVITKGCTIINQRIPLRVSDMKASCLKVLTAKGFSFVDEASVTRPY